MKVVLVYRSGGVYDEVDVKALAVQIHHYMGVVPYVLTDRVSDLVLIDMPCIPRPLTKKWHGWWSKMELFDPTLVGDILYMDLDTMLVEDCRLLLQPRTEFCILQDFYRPKGLQSSFMYIPSWIKPVMWNTFTKNPDGWMREFAEGGDQSFIELQCRAYNVRRWQEMMPGAFVSYKATMNRGPVPPDARVVIFHGQPKPRDILWKLDMHLKVTAGSVDTCGPLTTLSAQRSSSTPSTPMASSPSSAAGASE